MDWTPFHTVGTLKLLLHDHYEIAALFNRLLNRLVDTDHQTSHESVFSLLWRIFFGEKWTLILKNTLTGKIICWRTARMRVSRQYSKLRSLLLDNLAYNPIDICDAHVCFRKSIALALLENGIHFFNKKITVVIW